MFLVSRLTNFRNHSSKRDWKKTRQMIGKQMIRNQMIRKSTDKRHPRKWIYRLYSLQ
jgi:hypothetical protein